MEVPSAAAIPSLDQIEEQRDLEFLFKPYMSPIRDDLHCPITKWIDHRSCIQDGGFEAALAMGLRRVTSRGNSELRKLASEALANLHCLGRFHAGDAGVCRITWGDLIKLDDCACQNVTIGQLHFCAVDFGDSIQLNEFLQRKLVSSDRLERNQCAVIAAAAGLIARDLPKYPLPARSRVIQSAVELRVAEWQIASPLITSDGAARSFNEKTLLSLRRAIFQPGHGRDYRSMCIFLADAFETQHLAIRVFCALTPVAETPLYKSTSLAP